MYTILCNIHDIIVYSVYIYIYTKRVLWPLFHAEFIYVRFKETRRTLLCSGTRKFSDIHERVKKKKDRRQILRPSRVSRECLNVVYFTCVHMYFVRSMSSRIIGRKVWSNPLGEDFWGWFSPVDDNSLRVEIFGYRSNGIMQTENIFYIFFSLIERSKNIYILHFSSLLKPLNSIETIPNFEYNSYWKIFSI